MEKQVFKPILFSTPMVQAILEERKTQTRRTLGININHDKFISAGIWTTRRIWNSEIEENPNPLRTYASFFDKKEEEMKVYSKYQNGDILWVRENFCTAENWDHWNPASLPETVGINYKADLNDDYIPKFVHRGRWRPSIHMPKQICRIFLEVTNVRVERLQDISEVDARAEGIIEYAYGYFKNYTSLFSGGRPKTNIDFKIPCDSFKTLWESINGKDSWKANPWV
jgi:hypothetical protein